MEIIRNLIQTIVVIVVLAVFLEMLMPPGEMRRYLKTVLGLLIILAVLQAAATALKSNFLEDVSAITAGDDAPAWAEIMAAGQKLADQDREGAVDRYRGEVAKQVLALARLNPDVAVMDARVETTGEGPEIQRITIVFAAQPGGAAEEQPGPDKNSVLIEDVEVQVSGPRSSAPVDSPAAPHPAARQAAAQVQKNVADLFNLSPAQVQWEFRD